jgi:hypothetical protein
MVDLGISRFPFRGLAGWKKESCVLEKEDKEAGEK